MPIYSFIFIYKKEKISMSTEIIIALIGVFSTIVSSWTTWFLTRKKYNSEVDQNLI